VEHEVDERENAERCVVRHRDRTLRIYAARHSSALRRCALVYHFGDHGVPYADEAQDAHRAEDVLVLKQWQAY